MSSLSVNGSNPNVSSSRATRMAMPSESSPESSRTRSSVKGGRLFVSSSAIRRISEITVALTDMLIASGSLNVRVDDDALDQRAEELDAYEQHLLRQRGRERHLRFQRAEELLGMGDVADAVDVRVFHLGRALALGQVG